MDCAEIPSAGEQAAQVSGILTPGDNKDLVDAGFHQGRDRVIDHELVVDWQQMFIGSLVNGYNLLPTAREYKALRQPPSLLSAHSNLTPLFFYRAFGRRGRPARALLNEEFHLSGGGGATVDADWVLTTAKLDQSDFRRTTEAHRQQGTADAGTCISFHTSLFLPSLQKAPFTAGGRYERTI